MFACVQSVPWRRTALQLLDVIEGLKLPDSGKQFDFEGEEVPT